MAKGEYQWALARLSDGEKYTKPEPEVAAEIVYLKGVCYEGLHKRYEAKAMFQFVADHFADTQYGYLAKEKLKEIEKMEPGPFEKSPAKREA